MKKNIWALALIIMAAFHFTACDDDDPVIPIEPELITTLTYTLTPTSGGTSVTMVFRDLDGDGGNNPEITGGTLALNESYTGTLSLLNESETPAENITEEIEEADEEHQFFFQSSLSDLTVAYNDQDSNGNPIGLNTTVTTGAAGTGSLTVTLRHEPNKGGSGVDQGNIANAGGETDIEVTFPIDVQ